MVVATSALGFRPLQAAPLSVPEGRLRFTVLRNGSEIGSHTLSFDVTGDDLVVHIDVRMCVGFGPFTLFRYHHQGEELWRAGRFVSLDTRTDNNGEGLRVSARRVAEGVSVEATYLARCILPADAAPLTHWNVAAMSGRLFNPQDGKPLHAATRCQGMDLVALGDGKQVKAVRYSMDGKLPIDDWYDQGMVWTALQAKVKDGSTLRYVREA